MARFLDVLREHGYTDCSGILRATEYGDGDWIFIVDESEYWTVNLFVSGEFAGEPLKGFWTPEEAKAYTEGWLACLSK